MAEAIWATPTGQTLAESNGDLGIPDTPNNG
jgi:hypothetical protein